MQTKGIIWAQNDYGSLLEKVLKLPQLHFSKGPHYYKEVITLALMHSLQGSCEQERGRLVKDRKLYHTVEQDGKGGKKILLQVPETQLT